MSLNRFSLRVNKTKSPYFGTDGSPKDWQSEIKPGGSGELELMVDLASSHVKIGKLMLEKAKNGEKTDFYDMKTAFEETKNQEGLRRLAEWVKENGDFSMDSRYSHAIHLYSQVKDGKKLEELGNFCLRETKKPLKEFISSTDKAEEREKFALYRRNKWLENAGEAFSLANNQEKMLECFDLFVEREIDYKAEYLYTKLKNKMSQNRKNNLLALADKKLKEGVTYKAVSIYEKTDEIQNKKKILLMTADKLLYIGDPYCFEIYKKFYNKNQLETLGHKLKKEGRWIDAIHAYNSANIKLTLEQLLEEKADKK